MAEEKNGLEYQTESYHKVEKSRIQAFMDLFKRQKALPESRETKHKTTNVSIETTMGLREFRKNLVEKVGNFFQALSKIGAPKKDENLNKFAKEVVGAQNIDKSTEKTRNDDESVHNQQPRFFPGDISVKKVHEPVNHGTVIIAETPEIDLENEINSEVTEHDSSIDTGKIDIDSTFKDEKNATIGTNGLTASNINVVSQPETNKNTEPVIKPSKVNDEKEGPDL